MAYKNPEDKKRAAAIYRENNRQKIREYHKARRDSGIARKKLDEWHANHPGAMKRYAAKYYLRNKQAILARNKQWYEANKDRHHKLRDRWIENNRDRVREISRNNEAKHAAWRKRNPDKVRRYYRAHYEKNRDYFEAKGARRRAQIKNGCFSDGTADAFYKFVRSRKRIKCYYCGTFVSGTEAHVDHVIAVNRQGNHASSNLCASCERCNKSKGAKLPSEITSVNQPLLNL